MNKLGEKTKTASNAVFKRRKWLQQFFDELQRDKTLRSSEITYYFLSLKEVVQFEKKKKEFNQVPKIARISDIKHLEKKANIGLSNEKQYKAKNISQYVENCTQGYSKLNVSMDETVKALRTLSDCFSSNSKIFKEMAVLHASIDVK